MADRATVANGRLPDDRSTQGGTADDASSRTSGPLADGECVISPAQLWAWHRLWDLLLAEPQVIEATK